MRSLACSFMLVVCCLAVPGCAAFNKKSSDAKTPAAGSGTPPAQFPTSTDPIINGGNAAGANRGAVLAGRVIDNASKPPANTSIRLVSMDGKETSNPTEVNVDPNGYFTIQGLKSGANYKLLARGKNGDHILAGITYTKAPNLTVVIQVKEDYANLGTPDVQGTPAFQDKNPRKISSLDNSQNLAGNNDEFHQLPPVNVPAPGRLAPSAAQTNQGWLPGPNVASDKGTTWPPPLEIANPTVKPALPPLVIPSPPPLPPALPPATSPGNSRLDGAARVPSCVLLGNKLVNFALNDVNGDRWEFKNRRGKLVLIDFWSTTCPPCRETIPALVQLQTKYGGQGLEVIGVAIESGGTAQQQGYKVNTVARTMNVNYRQLVSSGADGPVCADFQVTNLPTMVLIDQDGMKLPWRHVGVFNRNSFGELERLIQSKLSSR